MPPRASPPFRVKAPSSTFTGLSARWPWSSGLPWLTIRLRESGRGGDSAYGKIASQTLAGHIQPKWAVRSFAHVMERGQVRASGDRVGPYELVRWIGAGVGRWGHRAELQQPQIGVVDVRPQTWQHDRRQRHLARVRSPWPSDAAPWIGRPAPTLKVGERATRFLRECMAGLPVRKRVCFDIYCAYLHMW